MQLSAMVTLALFSLALAPAAQAPGSAGTNASVTDFNSPKHHSPIKIAEETLPSVEGWWLPEGYDPHPSQLRAAIRQRLMAATVQLGPHRSGVFAHRNGLILTSAAAVADCIRALQASGLVSQNHVPFVASSLDTAPICPDMTASTIIEIRNVTETVIAAERAGSSKVTESLVTACNHTAPGRRCELITTQEGEFRLMVQREMKPVRLRYWPGPGVSELGGPQRSYALPRLRVDAAIVSVEVGRAGAPDHVRLATQPVNPEQLLWIWHHPSPSLRWASATLAVTFLESVLPTYMERTKNLPFTRQRQALSVWHSRRKMYLGGVRTKALNLIHKLRTARTPALRQYLTAFTVGRHAYHNLPWTQWAEQTDKSHHCPPFLGHLALNTPPIPDNTAASEESQPDVLARLRSKPICPYPLVPYASAEPQRRAAALKTQLAPNGPEGRNDLRVSKARFAQADDGSILRVRWQEMVDAAHLLNTPIEIPLPLPWSSRRALGYVLEGDVGPLTTGGPVVNRSGDLVGIVSGGNEHTLSGLFAYSPSARVSITSVHALRRLLRQIPNARGLAHKLGSTR